MTKVQSHEDLIDPARISALNATLGRDSTDLPPFGHHIFFWTALPEHRLGRDGHPAIGQRDSLIPDLGLPRRMWAGGRLQFRQPLAPNIPATKTSTCVSAERKTGRTGPLGLVTLHHEIQQAGETCLTEEQDLVYLPDGQPRRDPPEAPSTEEMCVQRSFSTTELFRYSALTFNGHRIHYDRDYAQQVEGYPGLVVHGPLLAQYLILLAEEALGGLTQFSFRATAPLFDFEAADFCASQDSYGLTMWVRGPDGRQCMTASAQ